MAINWEELEAKYNQEEMKIIREEVDGKEDWETDEEVLEDVVNNMQSYVEEHRWWNNLMQEKSQNDSAGPDEQSQSNSTDS